MKFSLDYEFELFELGPGNYYLVRELNGVERDRFLGDMRKRIDLVNGKPTIKDHTGMSSLLLSYSVFRIEAIEGWPSLPETFEELQNLVEELHITYSQFTVKQIDHATIRQWHSKVLEGLNPVAQRLSMLNDESKKE